MYKLTELLILKYGKNQKHVEAPIGYPIYGTSGIIGYANKYLYDKKAILFGRKGSISKVQFVEEPFWCVDTTFYSIINTNLVIPKYLYYKLSTIDFNSFNEGTTIPSLRAETLNTIEIEIHNYSEQQHIVDTIGSIDELIENYRKNIDRIDKLLMNKYRQAYEKNNRKISISELKLYVTDFVANGSFKDLKDNTEILDYPDYAYFIRNTDLKENCFNKYVNERTYNFLSKSSLFGNEILISNVGDVGSVYLAPVLNKKMTLGNNMIMTTFDDRNNNYYLYCYFKSYEGQYAISGITAGSAQQKFNKTDFKKLLIPLPDDETLQKFNKEARRIIEYKNAIVTIITYLDKLKTCYLKKFFG